ncbi:hypothetical protein [Paenibacillus terrigena]|uniref:hypothetical protein n=1 Tax=Paenibacillus terrigena TaxID=369333 RepID=UPI0028D2B7C6|nr:hypothetical protein [Paenibacillus terrigena]
MKRHKKLAITLALVVMMSQSFSAISVIDAAKANQQQTQVIKTIADLKPVSISAKSSVRLTDINLLTQDDGNVLSYTLTYKNGDNKELSLIDFWTRVKTKTGTSFSSNLMTKDKDKKKIAPQSEVSITYYSKVGNVSKISDLNIEMVKWDFSAANYERKLGVFNVPTAYNTETPSGKAKSMKINDISVNAIIDQSFMYKSDNYYYVNVSLRLKNTGIKVLEDPKYKFAVKTPDGGNYPLQVDTTGTDFKIQPKDSKTLNLIAVIPASTKTDKLQLQILQDDSTEKGVNSTIAVATFQLPIQTKNTNQGNEEEKKIKIGNSTVVSKISDVWLNQSNSESQATISLNIKNSSAQTVTIPKYNFVVHTGEGYTLPLTTKALDNVILKPQEEVNIRLNVSLPSYMQFKNLKLFMNQPTDPAQKDAISYPVAIFSVPEVEGNQTSVGSSYYIQNAKGNFSLKLSSIQRLPWSDGDMITAKIKIKNDSLVKSIEIPKIEGLFKIDGIQNADSSKIVQSNSSLLVGPGKELDLYLSTKVPYDLTFNQLQILLSEKLGENSNDLIQLSNTGSISKIPTIENGKIYTVDTAGKRSEIIERRTIIYPGTGSNIIYTELEMKNIEDRQADLSHIVGFYATDNNQYYKASVSQVDHSTSPDGRNIVMLWTKLPRSVDSSKLKLIIGEGVSDDKMTPPKGDATGYVNAVKFELSQTKIESKINLMDLDLFPYKLSIKNLAGSLSGTSSVKVDFDYDLSRNQDYEMGEYGHKVVMELQDTSTGKLISKELTLESGELKVGTNLSGSASFDNEAFANLKSGSFKFNIYDQFQGEKVLIASQGYYYSTQNLNRNHD